MRMSLWVVVATVLALSLSVPHAWACTDSDVAALLENHGSAQSQPVRVTGTVSNHQIRRGMAKCFQSFTLEDETGSIEAVYKANCSGARNLLRDRDVVTVEGRFERTSNDSGMLTVRSILKKVTPSAQ
jgi:cytochrome c-type biogenesis protein CcmE